MSSTKSWTVPQRKTIDYNGRSLLLSAGAGSGKTATLTERVAKLVCDSENGVDVSRMLIVTFTVAAAKELKDRIGTRIAKELEENPSSSYIVKQVVGFENAKISTIDSFFYKAVKPHASSLGLPPDFRIAEDTACEVMKKRIMREVVDDFFEESDEEFACLADALSISKDENSLPEVLLDIEEKLSSMGADCKAVEEWTEELQKYSKEDFLKTPHGEVIREELVNVLAHYRKVFSSMRDALRTDKNTEKAYGVKCDEICDALYLLENTVKSRSYGAVKEAVKAFKLPALGRLKEEYKTSCTEYFASKKKALSDAVKKISSKVFATEDAVLCAACEKTVSISRSLATVLGEFTSRFENEKKEKGMVDFGDLQKYALRLFCNEDGTPTDAALEFSKQYDFIFIDEYQDTNKAQDAVFSAISTGMKRFMVGDVKQSIYAFRGADPSVFTSYRDKWAPLEGEPTEKTEATVFMNENFRSDKSVIDFTNLVSAYMFEGSDTPFGEEDKLIFSRIQPEGYREKTSEICLVVREGEHAPDEYAYVAERIASMIKNETKGDGTPYKPSDFAILLRNSTRAGLYIEELTKRGISVKDNAKDSFFEQPEVLLVLCLLHSVDNPLRDIYLAGAMKSPLFGFTVGDLLKIRYKKTDSPLWHCVREYANSGEDEILREKCQSFSDFTEEYRGRSRRSTCSELLLSVYERFSMMSLCESQNDTPFVKARIRRNLTSLYDYSRQYEKNSASGLYGFLKYLGELMESEKESDKPQLEENSVTVTTIHKSKGLEFPVCFLGEAAKPFNDLDLRENILAEPSVGIAMKIQDDSGLVRCDTPLRYAVGKRIKERSVCEEMRILYVAMTRAVEKLIVVAAEAAKGEYSDFSALYERAALDAKYATSYSKKSANTFLSWILPAVRKGGENFAEVRFIKNVNGAFTCINPETAEEVKEGEDYTELYRRNLSFVYPASHLSGIPAKLTVSKLKPDILDEDETADIDSFLSKSAKVFGTAAPYTTEYREVLRCENTPKPAFMKKEEKHDAAFAGTATHVFLQFCDFEALIKNGFEWELSRLLEKGFLTDEMAQNVSKEQIEAFAESTALEEIMSSPFVKREFRFNVALPAADFTRDEKLREALKADSCHIIVQGVCDIMYENSCGELVLLDYKTDRLTDYELKNREAAEKKLRTRHSLQLGYYRKAIEKIFSKKVAETAVYSLPLGDTVIIDNE